MDKHLQCAKYLVKISNLCKYLLETDKYISELIVAQIVKYLDKYTNRESNDCCFLKLQVLFIDLVNEKDKCNLKHKQILSQIKYLYNICESAKIDNILDQLCQIL